MLYRAGGAGGAARGGLVCAGRARRAATSRQETQNDRRKQNHHEQRTPQDEPSGPVYLHNEEMPYVSAHHQHRTPTGPAPHARQVRPRAIFSPDRALALRERRGGYGQRHRVERAGTARRRAGGRLVEVQRLGNKPTEQKSLKSLRFATS